jgi:hypothetical protein
MNTRNKVVRPLLRTITRNPNLASAASAASVAILGKLGRRSRRRAPNTGLWAAAGLLVAGAGAFVLASSTRRNSVLQLLQRAGGGLGGRLGELLGGQVGAHPLETRKLVRAAEGAFSPNKAEL